MKYKYNIPGKCPKCGSDDIHCFNEFYDDAEDHVYEYECSECQTIGREYYEDAFVGHDVFNIETKSWEIVNADLNPGTYEHPITGDIIYDNDSVIETLKEWISNLNLKDFASNESEASLDHLRETIIFKIDELSGM